MYEYRQRHGHGYWFLARVVTPCYQMTDGLLGEKTTHVATCPCPQNVFYLEHEGLILPRTYLHFVSPLQPS